MVCLTLRMVSVSEEPTGPPNTSLGAHGLFRPRVVSFR